MKVTAKQVAEAAGVSLSAVSRAFAPDGAIDPEKRKKILETAAAMSYVSPARRAVQEIAKDTVTLVAGDLLNPFYPLVLETLAQKLLASGRHLNVYAVPADGNIDSLTEHILAQRPAAVILTSVQLTTGMARACRRIGIKAVLLNRIQADVRAYSITCDNFGAGREAATHLLGTGRARIGLVGGIANTSTHLERVRGFRDTLGEAGQNLFAEISGRYDYGVTYQAVRDLLKQNRSIDALFCCNDIMALAAIDAARQLGHSVGDDIAIVGCDDIPMAAWDSYQLTTIRQPINRMVDAAISLISDTTLGEKDEGSMHVFPGRLIKRSSG